MNIIATYELGGPQAFRPAPQFLYWNTAKLGSMVKIARQRVAEAQTAFDATLAVERRRGKRSWESECLTERRKGPRLGPEYRREDIWRQLPVPIMNQVAVAME